MIVTGALVGRTRACRLKAQWETFSFVPEEATLVVPFLFARRPVQNTADGATRSLQETATKAPPRCKARRPPAAPIAGPDTDQQR